MPDEPVLGAARAPAAAGSAVQRPQSGAKAPSFVLTTSCPDTRGIVAGVSGFLALHSCSITEAQHYDDPFTVTSFMRAVFHGEGPDPLSLEALHAAFAQDVGAKFRMQWKFHEVSRKCRVVLAVSKHGHCLNSMLHRWSTGTLPIDVMAVVSNHQDMRSLTEWHGIPFHYFPVIDGRKAEQEKRLFELFERTDGELFVLARYMQILSADACKYFAGKAINIHHSFLPGFKGANAYHQAHERGVKLIGATAHYVTAELDEGPIIEQDVERVDHALGPEDFTAVGRDVESVVLARAVRWHVEHRVLLNGRKTVVFQ